MKIIKKGCVIFSEGKAVISGWHIEGGTGEELRRYATWRAWVAATKALLFADYSGF